jgi:hypothetical protein
MLKYLGFGAIGLGVLLLAVGLLFEYLELSDLWQGVISGPVIMGIGVILLIIHFLKNRKS